MLDKLDGYLAKVSQNQEQTMTPRTAVLDSLDMRRIAAVDTLNGSVYSRYARVIAACSIIDNFLALHRLRNKIRVKAAATETELCVRLSGWMAIKTQL